MAEIDEESIQTLSELCRIRLNPESLKSFVEDLGKILNDIEQLQCVDTEGVIPCNHVLEDMVNVEREDVVGATLSQKEFLKNSPQHVEGMIKVPPIIKQG